MFIDRQDAGKQLAQALMHLKSQDPIVLALPRGGVPIGNIVAKALDAPLEVLLVKKIGAPYNPELAIGSVAGGDVPSIFIDKEAAYIVGADDEYIQDEVARKLKEIDEQYKIYKAVLPSLNIKDRTIIIVDDGIATGATIKVALKHLRAEKPKFLVLAVPVAPIETIAELQTEVDELICLTSPTAFGAISLYYQHFDQVSDSAVIEILSH